MDGEGARPVSVMIGAARVNAHVRRVSGARVSYRRVYLSRVPVGYLAVRARPA